MCCCCGSSGNAGGIRMTRCGVICGLAALAALSAALLGPAWLHTEERFTLSELPRQFTSSASVRFKLGLFKVCPRIVKPANLTIKINTPACTLIRYSNMEDVRSQDLGFQQLEFTPNVISKMRISAPFQAMAAIFILAGTISALIGHCFADHRTLIACGLFLLGGLSLGGGLIVLASALSDASLEVPHKYDILPLNINQASEDNGLPQYKYGWCLQLSGLALILAKIAAVLTVSGYMARFPTVEDMVKVMVPGAERKLREQRGFSSEYLVRTHQKSPGPVANSARKGSPHQRSSDEGTVLLCKSAPDICASNPQAISFVDKADLSHALPSYTSTEPVKCPPDHSFTFVDKSADQNPIIDSHLSTFCESDSVTDSRIFPDTRQNMIAFPENKEHETGQEFGNYERTENPSVAEPRISGYADKESMRLLDSRLSGYSEKSEMSEAPYYDPRYNNLAGQTVPITLKHPNTTTPNTATVAAIQSQYAYQNFGTIHTGMLRVSEPGTSSSSNSSSQRSMTLQNPKRKAQIAQNTFSTLECEKRKQRCPTPGKPGLYNVNPL